MLSLSIKQLMSKILLSVKQILSQGQSLMLQYQNRRWLSRKSSMLLKTLVHWLHKTNKLLDHKWNRGLHKLIKTTTKQLK